LAEIAPAFIHIFTRISSLVQKLIIKASYLTAMDSTLSSRLTMGLLGHHPVLNHLTFEILIKGENFEIM
jgi:hypothetical protein